MKLFGGTVPPSKTPIWRYCTSTKKVILLLCTPVSPLFCDFRFFFPSFGHFNCSGIWRRDSQPVVFPVPDMGLHASSGTLEAARSLEGGRRLRKYLKEDDLPQLIVKLPFEFYRVTQTKCKMVVVIFACLVSRRPHMS